jgi:pimeloyl-ACP methyl ester carboxylesterase
MIHALPGMGADRRMFPAPWTDLPDFTAHDWRHAKRTHVLSELAAAVATDWQIQDGDILVGCSLGGMVACEITRLRRIPRLFLVGSAIRREEVSAWLAALHPLVDFAPIDWMRFSASKVSGELASMFADSEPEFIRTMCKAILEWDGQRNTNTKVFRIHGRHDLVIPPPHHVDLLLEGGHLIAMTHATECSAFVGGNLD